MKVICAAPKKLFAGFSGMPKNDISKNFHLIYLTTSAS